MERVSKRYIRTEDFRPKIEDVDYVRMTFTLPKHLVSFYDEFDELEHRNVPEDEMRLLGLMLSIARHNGYCIKKLLLQEVFRGMNQWGIFEDEDAEELLQFVYKGIRQYHVHGPFDDRSWDQYLASIGEDIDPIESERAA